MKIDNGLRLGVGRSKLARSLIVEEHLDLFGRIPPDTGAILLKIRFGGIRIGPPGGESNGSIILGLIDDVFSIAG